MNCSFCTSCGSDQIETFYTIDDAPVYSMVTIKNREDALNVPRKKIELVFCSNCGFIFNHLFDTGIDYFTIGYEDQQAFSETFMRYLTRISNELIDK